MRQVRRGSATYCYPAGDLRSKSAERARTLSELQYSDPLPDRVMRSMIPRGKASLATLSRELGINPKTVAKWRKRQTVDDRKTGPTEPRSMVLTEAEEAATVAFRRHTLLPLDECLSALQPSIPHLTRSALHRCLQRHDISRLPKSRAPLTHASMCCRATDKPKRSKVKCYPIGFFHIDTAG